MAGILGALGVALSQPHVTSSGASDVVWALTGGFVAGSLVCAGAPWNRRFRRGLSRVVGAVAVVALMSFLSLPGPFGLESLLAWGVVAACGLNALATQHVVVSRRLVVGGVACALTVLVVVGITSVRLRHSVLLAQRHALDGVDALKKFDVEAGTAQLELASQRIDQFAHELDGFGGKLMGLLPVVAVQREHAERIVSPLQQLLRDSIAFAETRPDENLSVQAGRLNLDAVKKLESPLLRVGSSAESVVSAASTANSPWLLSPVRTPLRALESDLAKYQSTLLTTLRVVRELPWLLGADAERTFFLSIVTPVENRSGGGFPGAFGILSARDGEISVREFGSIGLLIGRGNRYRRVITGPLDYLARYEQYGAGDGVRPAKDFFWSNITASPDHPSVAEVTRQMYRQSGGGNVDGVITLDVEALARFLEITGPVQVEGITEPVSADNAREYLYRTQYFRLNSISNQTRRDRMYAVASAITDRLTSMDLPSPSRLAEVLGPAVANGNIRFTFFNSAADELAHYLGADGAFGGPTSVADVAVTTTNGSPNKIDSFLQRTITHRVNVANNGDVVATTTVKLTNDAPPSGFADYVLGNEKGYPRGTNVTILTLYSPLYCSTTVDGVDTPNATEQELGWLVHSLGFGVPPKGTTTVVFTCTGNTSEVGLGVETPRIHGQVVVNDDQWNAKVVSPKKVFTYNGAVNSNKWIALR